MTTATTWSVIRESGDSGRPVLGGCGGEGPPPGLTSTYRCGSGECVLLEKHCDGVGHCDDGSDEAAAQVSCDIIPDT